MRDAEFEWDDAKAAANFARHGVTFEMARDVFKDVFAVDWMDEPNDQGETRFAVIGMVASRLLFVAYTMRGDRIRIISARGAASHERRRYHEKSR